MEFILPPIRSRSVKIILVFQSRITPKSTITGAEITRFWSVNIMFLGLAERSIWFEFVSLFRSLFVKISNLFESNQMSPLD